MEEGGIFKKEEYIKKYKKYEREIVKDIIQQIWI